MMSVSLWNEKPAFLAFDVQGHLPILSLFRIVQSTRPAGKPRSVDGRDMVLACFLFDQTCSAGLQGSGMDFSATLDSIPVPKLLVFGIAIFSYLQDFELRIERLMDRVEGCLAIVTLAALVVTLDVFPLSFFHDCVCAVLLKVGCKLCDTTNQLAHFGASKNCFIFIFLVTIQDPEDARGKAALTKEHCPLSFLYRIFGEKAVCLDGQSGCYPVHATSGLPLQCRIPHPLDVYDPPCFGQVQA
mmetsp:Transcript_57209/g.104502  ORF Transcript_57209/g.104502 Transcript_57209/m.104502 type:complete len:243 (-) Transcript_57209:984-1712(-)